MEIGKQVALGSMWSLFPLVLGEMIVIRLVGHLVSRRHPLHLSTSDYINLYLLVNMGTALNSFDGVHALTGLLAFPFSRQARFPGWSDRWLNHLPKDFMLADTDLANLFVQGGGSFWTNGVWSHWLIPSVFWSVGHLIFSVLYLSLSCLLYRRWTDHQRLSFPLTTIPLSLLSVPPSPILSRRFFAGALLSCALSSYNRWHFLYPFLPVFPITIRQVPNPLVTRPWSALGDFFFGTPLWMIGVSFLVPLDVLFSSWFFYWIWRLTPVGATLIGLQEPLSLYLLETSFGAYMGLALAALWLSRRVFSDALFGGTVKGPPPLSFERVGLLLFVTALLLYSLWGRLLLLSVFFLGLFVLILILTAVSVSRIRAELGAAVYGMMGMAPPLILSRTIGMAPFRSRDLAIGMGILTYGYTYAQRSNLMPLQLEGMRLAQMASSLSYPLVLSLAWTPFIGSFFGMLMAACVFTRKGALSGKISLGYHNVFVWAYRSLAYWETDLPQFRWAPTIACLTGVCLSLVFQGMRIQLPFLPVHPLGFAIAGDYNCHFFWNSLAVAWAVKGLLLRYGGISAYRAVLPFALGLSVGDFIAMVANGLILAATPYRVAELTL
ncbi:MAG: hypothetical protein NZ959_11180 [Armatimonadetes bacterium]|nr:hypothetical protein [Armatimonadota bacterium]